MKKTLWILLCIVSVSGAARAQIWKEWFQQKKTQKEYLIAQIAALKAYKQVLWTGYEVARDGLTLIGDIKNGDFNMHKGYFASLSKVSGPVKDHAQANGIAVLHRNILITVDAAERDAARSEMFTDSELSFLKQVFDRVRLDCINKQEEFKNLTTNGALVMKDDERIKRMDGIRRDMQDNLVFARSFAGSARVLAASRKDLLSGAQSSGQW